MPPEGRLPVIESFDGGGPLGPPPFSVYPLFSGGMWKKTRRPGPGPGADRGGAPWVRARSQRWEAVFRRERRPASLDRTEKATCFFGPVHRRKAEREGNAAGLLRGFSPFEKGVLHHESVQCEKAGGGRAAVRPGRGGQHVHRLPRLWQQVRPGAAHGQHPVRRVPGPLVRGGRGLWGQSHPQPAGRGQPDGLPGQHVRGIAVRFWSSGRPRTWPPRWWARCSAPASSAVWPPIPWLCCL